MPYRPKKKVTAPPVPLKLDLGSGKNKAPGFIGVDSIKFDGIDVVADLTKRWPWKDGSVDEARASHFVEHLEPLERIHFVNELYRVLKVGGTCQIIVPSWSSCRAYGDMTHKWPPVSEFWFYYLNSDWRKVNAPHDDIKYNPDGYTCHFSCAWGYSLHPSITSRNQEYQQHAAQFWKEAVQDIICTFTKVEMPRATTLFSLIGGL